MQCSIPRCHLMTTPLFKKKNVRGTRRKRETPELEENETSSIFSARKDDEGQSLNASKWARYASLQKNESQKFDEETTTGVDPKVNSNFNSSLENTAINVTQSQIRGLDIEDGEDMPQIAPDNETMRGKIEPDLQHLNQAYIKVTTENLELFLKSGKSDETSTFTLKESYFRDTPIEPIHHDKEYADKYGNVSDDDITERKVDAAQSDDDVEVIDEFTKPNLAIHKDFYDMEVSVDEELLEFEDGRVPSIEELQNDIMQRVQKLEISIRLRSERIPQLENSLAEAEKKRLEILKRLEAL